MEDKKLKVFQNMKDSTAYHFDALEKDAPGRFVLHFAPVNAPGESVLPAHIYYEENEIVIDLKLVDDLTEVTIADVLGRIILQNKLAGKSVHRKPIDAKNQAVILYAASRKQSMSCKVFIY